MPPPPPALNSYKKKPALIRVNMQPRNMIIMAGTQHQSRKDGGVLMFLMYQGGQNDEFRKWPLSINY